MGLNFHVKQSLLDFLYHSVRNDQYNPPYFKIFKLKFYRTFKPKSTKNLLYTKCWKRWEYPFCVILRSMRFPDKIFRFPIIIYIKWKMAFVLFINIGAIGSNQECWRKYIHRIWYRRIVQKYGSNVRYHRNRWPGQGLANQRTSKGSINGWKSLNRRKQRLKISKVKQFSLFQIMASQRLSRNGENWCKFLAIWWILIVPAAFAATRDKIT